MKSILSVLPFVGLAIAQQGCTQEIVKVTETETIYATLPVASAADVGDTTITVDVTTTHTVYVKPTLAPYYPLPNGTHPVAHPSTFATVPSIIYVSPSPIAPVESAAATLQTAIVFTSEYSALPTSEILAASSTLEAALPASEVLAASSTSEAAIPVATSSNVEVTAALTGEATTYGGNVDGGMCSFTGYTIPSGIFGTALSDSNWAGAAACGACVSVKGPDGDVITAMVRQIFLTSWTQLTESQVVDQCPGCGSNHLDLFPDAYAELAPSPGIIPVSWNFVPCGITSPIQLKNKEGTSKFWFSMQVRNANVRVSKLEVSTDSGKTWKATTRQPYNYFENSSGFGTDTVDVKITSIDGKTVTVKSVSIAPNTVKAAGSNFV
jgi:expansin (peptidoglycan-binding protein)